MLLFAEIQNEEMKIKKSIKDAAKRGDTATAKLLAKEVVRSRRAVNRMHTSKAQMNSVVMQMENQLGARPRARPQQCSCCSSLATHTAARVSPRRDDPRSSRRRLPRSQPSRRSRATCRRAPR